MSAFSNEMIQVAKELITEFGEPCVFKRFEYAQHQPLLANSELTNTEMFTSVAFRDKYTRYEVENTISIERNDIKLLVAATDDNLAPSVNDVVELSNEEYRVVDVEKVTTNAVTVLYILQVRQ
jgi:hypothetical protein